MVDFTLEAALTQRAKVKTDLLALEAALDGAHAAKVRHLHSALERADVMAVALMQSVFGPFALPDDGDPKTPPPP